MRKVQIVASTAKGALPALVLAALLPAGASYSAQDQVVAAASAGGSGGAAQTSSATGGGGSSGAPTVGAFAASSSSTGTGGDLCGGSPATTFTVEIPPEGVPASAGQICAVVMSPVESNRSARVTLVKDPQALHLATGTIDIDPALAGLVVGLPQVAVLDTQVPALLAMQVTNVQPSGAGFTFDAQWPDPLFVSIGPWAQMTIKTTLEVKCDPQGTDTRIVEAITIIHLCQEAQDVEWVSSGDDCKICEIIAEMAPSPIMPDKPGDDLALGRALRLRLTVLARIGRAVVLLAENDGGPGLYYEWQPSAGRVVELAPDVVVWDPPEDRGPHLIQAAVASDDAAAVASYTWREVAA